MAALEELRDLAAAAAEAGGRVVREGAGRGAEAFGKGLPGDYVTEVDLASERRIRRMLEEATPDVPVVGEESGGEAGDRYWLVDPLDGTVNYLHGFWAVGVSVGLVEEGTSLEPSLTGLTREQAEAMLGGAPALPPATKDE